MKQTNRIGWHVLYVRSRHEKKVYSLLLENKLEAFLPLISTVRKWSDRKKRIEVPLFSSYVFVKINSPMDFYRALNINGASAYIRFSDEYAIVRENEIRHMKLLVGNEDITDVKQAPYQPKIGQISKIKFGPLMGLECEVLKIRDKCTIQVCVNSLKQNIVANIPSFYFSELPNAG